MRQLTSLDCAADPAWSLALLRAAIAAGRLQIIRGMTSVREEHLRAAHAAPGLLELTVQRAGDALREQAPVLPALDRPSSLQGLGISDLPGPTVGSLLRAHRDSLERVAIPFGVPGPADPPFDDQRLADLLVRCGLARMTVLVLNRPNYTQQGHLADRCRRQMEAVRAALPALQRVMCAICDRIAFLQGRVPGGPGGPGVPGLVA